MPAILLVVGALIVVGAFALAFLPSNKPVEEITLAPIVEEVVEDFQKFDEDMSGESTTVTDSDAITPPPPSSAPSTYVDGTYTTNVSYRVPSGDMEPVQVKLTLSNDIVTDVELEFEGIVGTSRLNQAKFVKAYEPVVIGKDIDTLNLSRVGGASLTTKAFNEALVNIKTEAAA